MSLYRPAPVGWWPAPTFSPLAPASSHSAGAGEKNNITDDFVHILDRERARQLEEEKHLNEFSAYDIPFNDATNFLHSRKI